MTWSRGLASSLTTVFFAALVAVFCPSAEAVPAAQITANVGSVSVGNAAYLNVTVRRRFCRIETSGPGGHGVGRSRSTALGRDELIWTVPPTAAAGTAEIGVRCGSRKRAVPRGKLVRSQVVIVGGRGSGLPIPLTTVKLVRLNKPGSEKVNVNGLPEGKGNPADYTATRPAGAGGEAFTSYFPLATGAQAPVTEAPGGRYSHNTVYTQNAIDLGVPVGTEIHAGLPGVIARVNGGCSVGQTRCGNGYGNYVYLKATDGTCAIMAHLSKLAVALGQQISLYDVIGLSGNTGNSSGPHIHYDHVNCDNNQSIPWTPIEGGNIVEGATIASQNHPDQPAPTPPTPPTTPTPPAQPGTKDEVAGGNLKTFSDFSNAGGQMGPGISNQQTVPVLCIVQGFKVADGNTNWYKLAGQWQGFYASADGFYNGAPTGGSLQGTPFVDSKVSAC